MNKIASCNSNGYCTWTFRSHRNCSLMSCLWQVCHVCLVWGFKTYSTLTHMWNLYEKGQTFSYSTNIVCWCTHQIVVLCRVYTVIISLFRINSCKKRSSGGFFWNIWFSHNSDTRHVSLSLIIVSHLFVSQKEEMANHLSESLPERTFQYQSSLPALPVPTLEMSLSKYLDSGKIGAWYNLLSLWVTLLQVF